jgi:hypothetical protein
MMSNREGRLVGPTSSGEYDDAQLSSRLVSPTKAKSGQNHQNTLQHQNVLNKSKLNQQLKQPPYSDRKQYHYRGESEDYMRQALAQILHPKRNVEVGGNSLD